MIEWLLTKALTFVDQTIQRAIGKGNRLQTFAGVTGGAGILAVMTYMETQMGCNLGELKLAALVPVIQGAYATGATRTLGDDEHDRQGGNSV